jgi:hypothetical protein
MDRIHTYLNNYVKHDIVFRNEVKEIPSTTFGAFSLYKYPAKFIPQIIAYIFKEYCTPGMKVIDPFAGYGTVGVVSRVYGYNYILWDLNPILEHIHNTTLLRDNLPRALELVNESKWSDIEFIPQWKNLHYWFCDEFLQTISRTWGFLNQLQTEEKYMLMLPLLKITRHFSNSDEKIHKLYSSKYSKLKIEKLKQRDWLNRFFIKFEDEVRTLHKKLKEFQMLNPVEVDYHIEIGSNISNMRLEEDVDILITSPPYLQAQEYIRSTKLQLFWLGYTEDYIKQLSKCEIPYNEVKKIEIKSNTFLKFRNKIKEPHLLRLYDNYFHSILDTFTRLSENVNRYLFIFVGPAKIRTTSIPIDDIIAEHLWDYGWQHKITYIDKIIARSMFKSKINPASKLADERIATENLIVLERKS